MLIALLTDIHANREALDACLAHAAQWSPDRYVFLGDYVGYGADPGYVVDVVERYVMGGAIALRGNHDEAAIASSAGMNETARAAIEWTRRQLNDGQRAFLASRPFTHEQAEYLFVHANAEAPHGWEYVMGPREARRSLMATRCRCVLCGHLHVPGVYRMAPDGAVDEVVPIAGAVIPLPAPARWLAVLGAVGQPRDRNPDACYALLDDDTNELTYVRVPYDVGCTAHKIVAAGLPQRLAVRLVQGW